MGLCTCHCCPIILLLQEVLEIVIKKVDSEEVKHEAILVSFLLYHVAESFSGIPETVGIGFSTPLCLK